MICPAECVQTEQVGFLAGKNNLKITASHHQSTVLQDLNRRELRQLLIRIQSSAQSLWEDSLLFTTFLSIFIFQNKGLQFILITNSAISKLRKRTDSFCNMLCTGYLTLPEKCGPPS